MDVVAAVEFERWCEEIQLSTVTRQLLKSEGFTTLDSVRDLEDSELEVLNLDSSQRNILETALNALNTRASQTSHQPTPIAPRSRHQSNEDTTGLKKDSTEMRNSTNSTDDLYPRLDGFENEFNPPAKPEILEAGPSIALPVVDVSQPPEESISKEQEPEEEKPVQSEAGFITMGSGKQKKNKSKPMEIAAKTPKSKNNDEMDAGSPLSPSTKSGGFLNKLKIGKDKDKTPKEKDSKKQKEPKDPKDKKSKLKIPKFKGTKLNKNEAELEAETPTEEIPSPVEEAEPENKDPENDMDTSCDAAENGPVFVTDHPLAEPESPTVKSLKEKFLEQSTLKKGGYPEIYQLPQVTISRDDSTFIRHCEIAIQDFPVEMVTEEKVLLCVGATGAGKTTLINGLANYLLNVQWDDPYRFQIIPDSEDIRDMACHSQTQYITAYTFYIEKGETLNPCKITIIDTPGFGDTEGISKDKELDEKIRNLFDGTSYGLDQLNGVCFTTQASETKMNAYQRYIYNRVLSIFGKDVEQNIFMMVTFSDASMPQVIKTLEENSIPFRKYFKFNNSALFADNKPEDENEYLFNKMFWDMGTKSFQSFLDFLDSAVEPVTLSLTKEVLAQRETLQVYIQGLQENVKKGLTTLDELRQEMNVVKQHEADIAKNQDFTYKVKEYYTERVEKPEGRHVTNCLNCSRTCHLNCKYAKDEDKKRCSAMDANGDCRVCTPTNGGKCSWDNHYNQAYFFKYMERIVEKRSEELFKKYKQAADRKVDAENLLGAIADKFQNIQGEVLWQTNEIRRCLAALGEIALKPNPLTTVDYIDQMIIAEKDTCQPGWRERIHQLESARKQAEYLKKLEEEGYDPWEEHERGELDIDGQTKQSSLESVKDFLHKLRSGSWAK